MSTAQGGAGADLVLRPSPRAPGARRLLIEGALLGLLLIAVLLASELAAPSVLGWVLIGLCVCWYGLLPWLYFRNASLYVAGGAAGKTDLVGRRREVAAARVARVRVVQAGRRTRKVVLEDAAGAPLLAVYATAWTAAQLEDLERALRPAADTLA